MESEETSKAEGTSKEDKPMDVAANAPETDEKTEDVEAGKKEEGKATEEAMESEESSKGEGTSKEDVESQKNTAPDAEKENVNPNTSTPDSEGVIKSTLNLLAKKIRGD